MPQARRRCIDLSIARNNGDCSGTPFVDFFFVPLLKAGPLQIAIGMLKHIQGCRHQQRTTDLFGPLDPLRNEGLLSAAFAMTFGGRRRRQISKVLEHAESRDGHRAAAVKRHVVKEAVAPRGPRIFSPQRLAQLVACSFDLVDADLAYFEIGSELNRRSVAPAQARIAAPSNDLKTS